MYQVKEYNKKHNFLTEVDNYEKLSDFSYIPVFIGAGQNRIITKKISGKSFLDELVKASSDSRDASLPFKLIDSLLTFYDRFYDNLSGYIVGATSLNDFIVEDNEVFLVNLQNICFDSYARDLAKITFALIGVSASVPRLKAIATYFTSSYLKRFKVERDNFFQYLKEQSLIST